jgi:hypothetical protein
MEQTQSEWKSFSIEIPFSEGLVKLHIGHPIPFFRLGRVAMKRLIFPPDRLSL